MSTVKQRIPSENINPETKPLLDPVADESSSYSLLVIMASFMTMLLFTVAFIGALFTQCLSWIFLFPWFLYSPKAKIIVGGSIMRLWQGVVVMLNPFWTQRLVRPAPPGYKPGKTIIMVNHLSSLDPWLVTRFIIPWELKWVYKRDLERLPIIGWSVKLCYDLPIDFLRSGNGWQTKPGSVKAMMEKCKSYLDLGVGTVVFPEGTRSKTARLQPFKDGFFRLALEEKAEILPCVLHNTNSLWPLGRHLINPGTAYFSFGSPIIPTDDDTLESLQQMVKDQMINMLNEMPGYDPIKMAPLTSFSKERGGGRT